MLSTNDYEWRRRFVCLTFSRTNNTTRIPAKVNKWAGDWESRDSREMSDNCLFFLLFFFFEMWWLSTLLSFDILTLSVSCKWRQKADESSTWTRQTSNEELISSPLTPPSFVVVLQKRRKTHFPDLFFHSICICCERRKGWRDRVSEFGAKRGKVTRLNFFSPVLPARFRQWARPMERRWQKSFTWLFFSENF